MNKSKFQQKIDEALEKQKDKTFRESPRFGGSNSIEIKPLSVNQAWKGRRFKTKKYKNWYKNLYYQLPKKSEIYIPEGIKKLQIVLGFSNPKSDIDNPLKMLIDTLQNKYNFNDSDIYELNVTKVIVEKGHDYISFEFF